MRHPIVIAALLIAASVLAIAWIMHDDYRATHAQEIQEQADFVAQRQMEQRNAEAEAERAEQGNYTPDPSSRGWYLTPSTNQATGGNPHQPR